MLQHSPMYASVALHRADARCPQAKDAARARRFYEGKRGFRPERELAGGAKSAWFKDSEGNSLAIVQSL